MDGSQNGGRDSRYGMGYDLGLLNAESPNEIYNSAAGVLHSGGGGRSSSINSNLAGSGGPNVTGAGRNSTGTMVSSNSCTSGVGLRGVKRTSNEMCYEQNINAARCGMLNNMNEDCSPVMIENSYSPSNHHQKAASPPSNGKKTKGRVKIKMEYIDNKLRRYTTFSKRKTGIMKKAYELSTLTGTQVMLLVASETGHVYTFATRKLQPMITSEAGKALIQTCLNSPDPFPSGSGDQRMSATGFEETELSYNVADDEKMDSNSSSPYHTDSSDSSDTESIFPNSPSSVATATSASVADIDANNGAKNVPSCNAGTSSAIPALVPLQQVQNSISISAATCAPTNSGNGNIELEGAAHSSKNGNNTTRAILYTSGSSSSLICSFEQLERDFGIQAPRVPGGPHFIKIPLPNGVQSVLTPPAAHQTPADLSNRPRR